MENERCFDSKFDETRLTVLQCSSVTGDRRAVQAGGSVGERQEGDHVLAGLPNHLHLPHDIQLLPIGHSGMHKYWRGIVFVNYLRERKYVYVLPFNINSNFAETSEGFLS